MYFDITPDNEFIKTEKVPGPTKEEIRALVISKVKLTDEDVVVDVGCGTGGLTLEFAKRAKKIYSIDMNPDAIKTTRANLEKFGLQNKVELIEDEGLKALDHIEDFTKLMIGGSGGNLDNIIETGYLKLPIGGRIVITSIVLETATDSVHTVSYTHLDVYKRQLLLLMVDSLFFYHSLCKYQYYHLTVFLYLLCCLVFEYLKD